jgi:plasmid stabilization system protein ParE
MPTVGRRRVEIEDEGRIHFTRHTVAFFWRDGDELIAVLVLDTRAE